MQEKGRQRSRDEKNTRVRLKEVQHPINPVKKHAYTQDEDQLQQQLHERKKNNKGAFDKNAEDKQQQSIYVYTQIGTCVKRDNTIYRKRYNAEMYTTNKKSSYQTKGTKR